MAKRFKKSAHSDAPRSQRQLRVGELLRQKLSEVFSRGDVSGTNLDTRLVTVTEVRVSPDLKKATAFVVPLLQMTATLSKRKRSTVANSAADLTEELNRHAGALRIKMGDGLHLKYVPSLSFKSDDSFDNAAMMDNLLAREEVQRDLSNSQLNQQESASNNSEISSTLPEAEAEPTNEA